MPPWPRMLPRRAWRCLTLGLLLALAAACGPAGAPATAPATDMAAPDPAPAMPAPTPTPALLRPTPTPIVQDYPDITWQVAPSLEEQVFTSPVIVRASLQAAAAVTETVPSTPGVAPTYRPVQELRFTVHEYLKGSGPTTLLVVVRGTHTFLTEAEARADADFAVLRRVTAWDDRQGVLFLQTPARAICLRHLERRGGGRRGEFLRAIVAIHAVQLPPGARVGLQRGHPQPGLAARAGRGRGDGPGRGRRTAPAQCSSPTGRSRRRRWCP